MLATIECPYCREKVYFEWDYHPCFFDCRDCKKCKNTVRIAFEPKQAFKAFKQPGFCESNGNKHKYKKTDNPMNIYECTVCGELRSDTDERPNKQIRDQIVEG